MILICPACDYEPKGKDDQWIEIEGSSLSKRIGQDRVRSVNLVGCPKCKNVFMD